MGEGGLGLRWLRLCRVRIRTGVRRSASGARHPALGARRSEAASGIRPTASGARSARGARYSAGRLNAKEPIGPPESESCACVFEGTRRV
jgi:hypothetical protein